MKYDIDKEHILTAVGVIFAVASVVYFARDLVFDLSITVRSLLLFLAFVALLTAALSSTRSSIALTESVLAAAAYLAFLAYTLSRFGVGADGTFLALLVSAILFLTLGNFIQKDGFAPSRRFLRTVLITVILLAVILIGADIAASEVTYDIQINDSATISNDSQVSLGRLTVNNQFLFREPIDEPQAFACVYLPNMAEFEWRPASINYHHGDNRLPETISGNTRMTADISIGLRDEERAAIDGPIPVERTESCPRELEEQRILVVFGDSPPRPPRR